VPKATLTESQIQIEAVRLLHLFGRHDIMYFAVSNEGERTTRFGNRLKAQGMLPGTADLILVIDRLCHALEIKTEIGTQSTDQELFARAFEGAGGIYHLAKGLDEAIAVLTDIEAFRPNVHLLKPSARAKALAQLNVR